MEGKVKNNEQKETHMCLVYQVTTWWKGITQLNTKSIETVEVIWCRGKMINCYLLVAERDLSVPLLLLML